MRPLRGTASGPPRGRSFGGWDRRPDFLMPRADTAGQTVKSDGLLFLAAVIWGFAFVAQRVGMDYVGPFGFNGVRFALGCLVLLPFLYRNGLRSSRAPRREPALLSLPSLGGGLV